MATGVEPFVLALAGRQTLRTCEPLHAALVDGLAHGDRLVIDLRDLTEADLSLVQLLLAARKTALRQGKSVALAAPASGPLLDVLQRGGFVGPDAASGSTETSFWLKGADTP